MSGQKFGRLTVLSRAEDYISPSGNKLVQWLCKCDCGNEVVVSGSNLKSGRQVSCGCHSIEKAREKLDDLTGRRFGRLEVISFSHIANNRMSYWNCLCDCGNEVCVSSGNLKCGNTKSCGCYRSDLQHARKRVKSERLHYIWSSMKQRCSNENNHKYKDYGERGISVCKEWEYFENFYRWSMNNGYSDDLTIDRINNDKGYSPDNCRWATKTEQARNKRNTRFIEYDGEIKPLPEWAEERRIPSSVIRKRLKIGWSMEEALNIPVLPTGKNKHQEVI